MLPWRRGREAGTRGSESMTVTPPMALRETHPPTSRIAEADIARRAAAILQQEIQAGALANIVEAERAWSAAGPRLRGAEAIRQLRRGAEDLADLVLDLLAPREPEGVVLRPAANIARGQSGSIATRLANDTTASVELRLRCSDLFTDAGRQIGSSCVLFTPQVLHLPAGQIVQLELNLCVPAEAEPGLYRAVMSADGRPELRALMVVPVV
jgi:hypothetical protein